MKIAEHRKKKKYKYTIRDQPQMTYVKNKHIEMQRRHFKGKQPLF